MKKSLIALAVLAASGAAMAQSSVTLYGIADVGLAYEDNGTVSQTRLDSGNYAGSRWGMSGTEDLGGGLKTIFTLEAGYNLDTGAQADPTSFFNRQSFVGFSGNFGTVKLGRQKNPIYATAGTWDSFGDALAGDSSHLFSYNGSRTSNMVSYHFDASGFYGEAQYAPGEVAGNNSASRTFAGFAGYKSGPFDVVLTTQNINDAATPTINTTKMTLIGGNYNFGMAKLFAAYAVEKTDGAVTTRDQKDMHIGVTVPVSTAGTVELSYLGKKDDLKSNADAHQVAIGYLYSLSKRTTLYTSYAQLSNDANAAYRVTKAGNTDKLFNIGVSHSF